LNAHEPTRIARTHADMGLSPQGAPLVHPHLSSLSMYIYIFCSGTKIRRRMGNPLFYFCPLLRPIFTMKCWDPNRKTSKLRNDAIKQRISNR